jgi:quinol monooxygenase YgiN
MSITTFTVFHAAAGQVDNLAELLSTGRDRMRSAEGCSSFDLLRDEADPRAMAFLQRWSSHEAHDAAFAERIVQSGHLAKVLAVLDEDIRQHTYLIAS